MGNPFSKTKPPPPKKKRKKRKEPEIHEYLPKSKLKTTTEDNVDILLSSKMIHHTPDPLDTTGGPKYSNEIQRQIPEWQRKWETDMRPSTARTEIDMRPSVSRIEMKPLPNVGNNSANDSIKPLPPRWTTPLPDLRARYYGGPFSFRDMPTAPYPDVGTVDERSIASTQVDGYHWIYKTDKKAINYWVHGARLWPLEPKRANQSWFIGHDNTKVKLVDETFPVKKRPYPIVYGRSSRRIKPSA